MKNATNRKFIFYADPGHAWLRVPLSDLEIANLTTEDFTFYSYKNGRYVYLEEDCDAGTFIDRWTELFGKPEIVFKQTNYDSIIRRYNRINNTK